MTEFPNDIIFGDDVSSKLLNGIEKIEKAVGATFGPKGQNVLIDSGHQFAPSTVTKDGVTVLRNIRLTDKTEQLAVKLIKEAGEKTVEECGDGTTTTTLLACAIYKEALKMIKMNRNPILLKRGMDRLCNQILDKIDEQKKVIEFSEQVRSIALISANGDEDIAELIMQAIDKVGKNGIVAVENGKSVKNELTYNNGFRIDRGWVSPYFITNPKKNTVEFNNPLILVTDYNFNTSQEILPTLEAAVSLQKPLVIIAEGGSAEVLQTLITNKLRGSIQVCAIDAPSFGNRKTEIMKDIAIATGATFISESLGFEKAKINRDHFGTCQRIVISKYETIISEYAGDKEQLEEKIIALNAELDNADNDYDISFLKERIANLSGTMATIRVGGITESEVEEKKDRIDDALGAVKAALQGGIVIGGGCALIRAANAVDKTKLDIKNADESSGVAALLNATKSPLLYLAENGSKSGQYVLEKTLEVDNNSFGFNIMSDTVEDLFEAGIIDPALVTKSALKNALSVASLLISSKVILMKEDK